MSVLQRLLASSFSPRESRSLDPAQPAGSWKAEKKQRDPSEIPACLQQGMSVGGQGNTRDGFPTQLLMIPQEIHLLRDQNTHHRFPAAHPLAIFPKGSIPDGRPHATEESA